MELVLRFSREDLAKLQTPVIVESWDKVKSSGSKKRSWLAEFTEEERAYLSVMHKNFYRWYLVTGLPDHFVFRKVQSIELIKKAVNFFASI